MGGISNQNGFHALRHNPNIDKYGLMRDEVIQSFKFNKRNTRNTFIILGLIPISFFYIAVIDSHKWEIRGKRRGESLYKYPSSSTTSTTIED
ncbi:hypothetical protein CROQUDRAFT_89984 [Cronartium quercuum f. sp. fusiforme G11]|uniref:NADH-ubiquinone oxidoreductase B15 subunit n=1 Tax=Cronartium quercuum f. sp. fusiforme G11 TaxID=708437 RepID=A0A9P6NR35_9BASI|nr:hypothetical protein CROQUDRAFT_89984 [Cronartium quercuum f. sp. fusiforme G11]